MSSRSLVASEAGINLAQKVLNKRVISRQVFSEQVGLAASTVSRFFNKRPVDRKTFIEICTFLDLDWEEVTEPYSDEDNIPQISPFEQLWQEITALGSFTTKMGVVLAKQNTLTWSWEDNEYETKVLIGSRIQVKVNFETPGYLLLVQKGSSGEAFCFCPSRFAPEPKLETGITTLPQKGSPKTSLKITGKPGKEYILAVITPDVPSLEWLPSVDNNPLPLNENHLSQLLDYINQRPDCKVFYTEYSVIE
jgi:DNA-binding Xre family transcriptional regulator